MLTTQLATTRLAELLRRTIEDLQTIERLLPDTMRRLDDAEPGYPGGGHGTATDDSPLRSTVIIRDTALKDAADLRKLLGRATTDARNILAICQRWGITRHGNNEAREPDEMWCKSCIRAGHMNPKREGNHGPNCRWCNDALRAVNTLRAERRLPSFTELPVAAVRWHAEGRKITDKVLDQWARDARR